VRNKDKKEKEKEKTFKELNTHVMDTVMVLRKPVFLIIFFPIICGRSQESSSSLSPVSPNADSAVGMKTVVIAVAFIMVRLVIVPVHVKVRVQFIVTSENEGGAQIAIDGTELDPQSDVVQSVRRMEERTPTARGIGGQVVAPADCGQIDAGQHVIGVVPVRPQPIAAVDLFRQYIDVDGGSLPARGLHGRRAGDEGGFQVGMPIDAVKIQRRETVGRG